jgi:hypothetical protein
MRYFLAIAAIALILISPGIKESCGVIWAAVDLCLGALFAILVFKV